MLTRRLALTSLGLAAPLLAGRALAHHGWGAFDASKPLDHAGSVLRSTYANPHGVVVLAREGRELTFELAPVARMQARGLAEADVAPGRPLRLLAYPHLREPDLLRVEWVEVGGRRVELR